MPRSATFVRGEAVHFASGGIRYDGPSLGDT